MEESGKNIMYVCSANDLTKNSEGDIIDAIILNTDEIIDFLRPRPNCFAFCKTVRNEKARGESARFVFTLILF